MTGNLTDRQVALLETVEAMQDRPLPSLRLKLAERTGTLLSLADFKRDYDWLQLMRLIERRGWKMVLTDRGRKSLREYRAERGCTVFDWQKHVRTATQA